MAIDGNTACASIRPADATRRAFVFTSGRIMSIDTADLRKVLQKVLARVPEGEDDDLWANGLMDSVMVVELVTALEERYAVQFTPDQLRKENFESVRHIRRTLESAGGR
jgi:acyl carrier protein